MTIRSNVSTSRRLLIELSAFSTLEPNVSDSISAGPFCFDCCNWVIIFKKVALCLSAIACNYLLLLTIDRMHPLLSLNNRTMRVGRSTPRMIGAIYTLLLIYVITPD